MFDEALAILTEVIAAPAKKKKTPAKKTASKSKKKKKSKRGGGDLPSAPLAVGPGQNQKDEGDEKFETKEKTPESQDPDKSDTSKTEEPPKAEDGKKDGEEPESQEREKLQGYLKENLRKAENPQNHPAMAQEANKAVVEHYKDKPDELKKVREEAEDLKRNPGSTKKRDHLALYVGLAVGAALVGSFAISPALGLIVGSKLLENLATPENTSRVIDHLIGRSREDRDETEDDENPRHVYQDDQENRDDPDYEDNKIDQRLGNGLAAENLTKEVLKSPELVKVAGDAAQGGISQSNSKSGSYDITPVGGKKNDVQNAWANRLGEYGKAKDDQSLTEDQRKQAEYAYRIASRIVVEPDRQNDILQEEANKKPAEKAQETSKSENEPAGGFKEQPPFPDEAEEDKYFNTVDELMDHDHDMISNEDIVKNFKLNGLEFKKFTDRMEREGYLSKSDKDGNRQIMDGPDNENEDFDDNSEEDFDSEDETDNELPPPKGKGKKVKATVESCLAALNDFQPLTVDTSWDVCIQLIAKAMRKSNNIGKSWNSRRGKKQVKGKVNIDGKKGYLVKVGSNPIYEFVKLGELFSVMKRDESRLEPVTALLNYRRQRPGLIGGQNLSDTDKLGPGGLNWNYKGQPVLPQNAPTYAALKLHPASGRLLKQWCESQGIQGVYPKHEFHVTVCYSKSPISYEPMVFSDGPREVFPDKFDLLGREPGKQYIVLKLKKGFPHERFNYARQTGASHDFPDYLPHISISPPEGHQFTPEDVAKLSIEGCPPLLINYEYADMLEASQKESINQHVFYNKKEDRFYFSL